QERKQIEEQAFEQALSQAEACASARPVVVLASENWHEGVIGIVAARIAERFYRPTILVAWDGDRGKGSGRSIPGFHLHDCLQACAQDLISFGGHKYAAGLVLAREKLPAFEQHVNEFAARTLGPDELKRRLMIDLEVSLEELDQSLLRVLEEFEPFGPENPRPVFVTYGLEVVGFPRRVGDRHLRFTVREKRQKTLPAIAYGRADDLELLQETQPPRRQVRQGDRTREKDSDFGGLGGSRADGREIQLDIAFQFGEHSYAGKTSLQLQVKDLHARRTSPDAEGIKREA
ncbi:MAG: DHHA1 domain-containing protein, partial [candidate division WOR-3 bacterium]